MKLKKRTGGKSATHSEIQNAVCGLLAMLEIPYSVTDAARVWSKNGRVIRSKVRTGWPDITAVLPPDGTAAFLEVKTTGDQVRPVQRDVLLKLSTAGAKCGVVRSVSDAVEWLTLWLRLDTKSGQKLQRLHFQESVQSAECPDFQQKPAASAFSDAKSGPTTNRTEKPRGES